MYKQECYKIFTKKSIYFVFAMIVLLLVYVNLLQPIDMAYNEEIFEELEVTWGGPVTEDNILLAREAMQSSDAGGSENTFESRATDSVHFAVAVAGMVKEEQAERMRVLEAQLKEYEEETYEYREASKELDMLNEVNGNQGFYLIRSWRGMFELIDSTTHVILLSLLLFLGVAPLFAEEYSKRTTDLLLATKYGKTKLVSAKILAGLTYIVTVFLSLHIVNAILKIWKFGGAEGWNAPIQGLSGGDSTSFLRFDSSPYSFDVWEFFLLSMGLQLLACIAVGILVSLLSFLTKNNLLTFFISAAIVGIPLFIHKLGEPHGFVQYLAQFNYSELMKASNMFMQFQSYNVLGYPVLYPILIFFIFALVTVLLTYLTYQLFRKQEVSS